MLHQSGAEIGICQRKAPRCVVNSDMRLRQCGPRWSLFRKQSSKRLGFEDLNVFTPAYQVPRHFELPSRSESNDQATIRLMFEVLGMVKHELAS